ncbi:MAG TPA: hypothetical protein VFW24_03715, partial [Acidimicrobiales bacterium]|nr:hypothetical protein [Acidimicrobiales bacterium]
MTPLPTGAATASTTGSTASDATPCVPRETGSRTAAAPTPNHVPADVVRHRVARPESEPVVAHVHPDS